MSSFFSKLNTKLDAGYKLTNSDCPICKKTILYNPADKSLFCVECNMPIKVDREIIDDSE